MIKLTKFYKWEYWSPSMFYIPNLPYACYLTAKARHFTFFSATNPGIKNSGNGTESKFKTIQLIPEKYRPKTILVTANTEFNLVISDIEQNKICFPLIAKPDIGFRGLLVQKINTENELKIYLKKYPITIIIQELLDYKNECGIFYHRNPSKKKGQVSSITLKHFLTVIGDGHSSLKKLILADNRAKLYLNLFKEIHKEQLYEIPNKEEKIILTSIGNHSKGTQFINGNHLISKKVEQTFDNLSTSITGWYYGRIDIKYNTFEELENGNNFKIIEINGIISEPTHIYDSESYTYFKALKSIRAHWKSLFEIATTNHKEHRVPYKSTIKIIAEILKLKAYTRKIRGLSNLK